jgi:hypothetical protein
VWEAVCGKERKETGVEEKTHRHTFREKDRKEKFRYIE